MGDSPSDIKLRKASVLNIKRLNEEDLFSLITITTQDELLSNMEVDPDTNNKQKLQAKNSHEHIAIAGQTQADNSSGRCIDNVKSEYEDHKESDQKTTSESGRPL